MEWSVLETASRGTKGSGDVRMHAIDTVRFSSVTTTAIETFVRQVKERHQTPTSIAGQC